MNIDDLIKKFELDFETVVNTKTKLDPLKDAEYWLLLGKSEALGNCIVDVIEEYSKESNLTEFQRTKLNIYKIQ